MESWNQAIRDKAPEEQRSLSNAPSYEPIGAAAGGGATADGAGQGRRVVQMRIPEPDDGDQSPARTPSRDGAEERGAEVVAARYRELPAEESARTAPLERCGSTSATSSEPRSRLPYVTLNLAVFQPATALESGRGDGGGDACDGDRSPQDRQAGALTTLEQSGHPTGQASPADSPPTKGSTLES
ncbi:hypothetical protein [Streptomyces microflavus]|uniref:hypothetical protein n=1 Tax=Streptomyces microflavus TaxID=1919 RepID=UPI0036602A4F